MESARPQTDTAEVEVAVKRARTTTNLAAVVLTGGKLWRALRLGDAGLFRHEQLLGPEREAKMHEERLRSTVRRGRGDEGDVHAMNLGHLVVVNLRKQNLFR